MIEQQSYDSVADFIASLNPQKVLEMPENPEMQIRMEALMEKKKIAGLTPEEKDELDHYFVLDQLIRLAKAHSHRHLLSSFS